MYQPVYQKRNPSAQMLYIYVNILGYMYFISVHPYHR